MDPVTMAIGGAAIVGASAASGNRAAPSDTDPGPGGATFNGGGMYSLGYWQNIVARLLAAEYPELAARDGALACIMKWCAVESAGNPCAIGEAGASFNGLPREIGLGQLYNPDDFQEAGIDPAPFRAYAQGLTQARTRNLTSDEEDDQVRWTLLWKIDQCAKRADAIVGQYGLSWSPADVWKLVKAPHALPAILNSGMPAVVNQLGGPPIDWGAFRASLGMNGNSQWRRALDACEAIGQAYGGA